MCARLSACARQVGPESGASGLGGHAGIAAAERFRVGPVTAAIGRARFRPASCRPIIPGYGLDLPVAVWQATLYSRKANLSDVPVGSPPDRTMVGDLDALQRYTGVEGGDHAVVAGTATPGPPFTAGRPWTSPPANTVQLPRRGASNRVQRLFADRVGGVRASHFGSVGLCQRNTCIYQGKRCHSDNVRGGDRSMFEPLLAR